jgi:carbamoyltransferase
MPFKKREWPGKEIREYRMVQGQDSSAALLIDGEVVAAGAEERFDRQKHSAAFPIGAIRYCLEEAGIGVDDLDLVAHNFDYSRYKPLYSLGDLGRRRYAGVYGREALISQVKEHLPELGDPDKKVRCVEHHLAHAASAYYPSGWDQCLVVVIDGMGEGHSATVWLGQDGLLNPLHRISASHSLGILYSLITFHLGFDFNSDEYKIMGLAPYGDPDRYRSFFERTVVLGEQGDLTIPLLSLNRTPEEREFYLATRRHLADNLIPTRAPDEDLTQDHRDVAAALQDCLNRSIHHICAHFARATGQRRLAMAGGVALNCTANGQLLASGLFDEIFVQPAAADDGTAVGAALACAASRGAARIERMKLPYWGPSYSQKRVDAAVDGRSDDLAVERFDGIEQTARSAARQIADGAVVGWYRGRMEFGPRALGNRSILANPADPGMRDRVNAMVKKREAFRPFAPAVSLAECSKWFNVPEGVELPYMVVIVEVRPQHRQGLPAVTHVNGTARVQTVAPGGNPDFHRLLVEVGRETGKEMVLNTSFNVKGQAIVDTPEQAIETFLATDIDMLYLGDTLVRRR